MFRPAALVLATAIVLAACNDHADVPTAPTNVQPTKGVATSPTAILVWNNVTAEFVALSNAPAPMPPTNESVIYGMVHGAIHDAVNAIVPRYRPYAYVARALRLLDGDIGPAYDAAVATAAYTILQDAGTKIANNEHVPNGAPLELLERRFSSILQAIPNSAAKQAGIVVGREAAVAMLSLRTNDGVADQGLAPMISSGIPGAYRATPPFGNDIDGMAGLSDGQHWAQVKPFVINNASQFRPQAPYGASNVSDAVKTDRYTADFNEVKRLGGMDSERTGDQTDIAFFWMENSPRGWNRAARTLASSYALDGNDVARLLALLNFAEADAYISAFDAKYAFGFWRPITAIHLADTDGNDDTAGDPSWNVASAAIGVPTPPIPDYSSGHATAGGAAAAVIEALMPGSTAFSMMSSSLPGKVRSFASVRQAAAENAESRVFIGYHFRLATEVGLAQGTAVGGFVAANALRPLN